MFTNPSENGYTIYTKSGCPYCDKAKALLNIDNPIIINCDEMLVDKKEEFLQFIKELTQKNHRTFPMVFKDSTFIGGYSDLLNFLKNEID
jgi:glutaredoxin 3